MQVSPLVQTLVTSAGSPGAKRSAAITVQNLGALATSAQPDH
jgi:hypothetical protein